MAECQLLSVIGPKAKVFHHRSIPADTPLRIRSPPRYGSIALLHCGGRARISLGYNIQELSFMSSKIAQKYSFKASAVPTPSIKCITVPAYLLSIRSRNHHAAVLLGEPSLRMGQHCWIELSILFLIICVNMMTVTSKNTRSMLRNFNGFPAKINIRKETLNGTACSK